MLSWCETTPLGDHPPGPSPSPFHPPSGQSISGVLERVAANGGSSGEWDGASSRSSDRTTFTTTSRSSLVSPLWACANRTMVSQACRNSCTSGGTIDSMAVCSHALRTRRTRKDPREVALWGLGWYPVGDAATYVVFSPPIVRHAML
jgi:hypothetical protein